MADTARLRIALAQINPHVGRAPRQRRPHPPAAGGGRAAGRGPGGHAGILHRRLSAGGPGPASPPSSPPAPPPSPNWPPRPPMAGRAWSWAAPGRTATKLLQRAVRAGGRPHRRPPRQARAAELRRLRREARLRRRPRAGPRGVPRLPPRPDGLRGLVVPAGLRDAVRDAAPRSCSRSTARPSRPTSTQRGASTSRCRGWSRPGCPSSSSARSAARTSWSSTAPPSC